MNKTLWIKVITVLVATLWGVIYILPNFVDVSKLSFYPGRKLNYGLDIQGGIQLVMGVDVEGVINESTRRFVSTLPEEMKKKNISIKDVQVAPSLNNQLITVELSDASQSQKAQDYFENDHKDLMIDEASGDKIVLRYNDVYLNDFKKKTLEQAIETIRNRIDEFGVSEPSITAQGTDRILVQLPGLEDSARAKDLINRTARLEFLIVNSDVDMGKVSAWIEEAEKKGNYSLETLKYSEYIKKLNEDIATKLPKDTKVLFEKAENAESMVSGKVPYVVSSLPSITGDDLKSAQVGFSQLNQPEVLMSFSAVGATKFANVTEQNVGKLMAIVLDDVIYTAPNIKERIGGGSASITLGNRNYDAGLAEANLISMALRAGALPAKLEQLEERAVGPSVGQDSIQKAEKAVVVGLVLVLLLMLGRYKAFGALANVALILNALLMIAILSSIGATLTLPGVAGIALTIGMAVDANVIIYERIREELARGLSLEAAIREGYAKAFSAIFDSNITTVATAILLMYFGTGPVRGFGLTLTIGICASMFTAIFVTKTIADVLVFKFKVKKMSV